MNFLQNFTFYHDMNTSGAQIMRNSYINCKSYSNNSSIVGRYNDESTKRTSSITSCENIIVNIFIDRISPGIWNPRTDIPIPISYFNQTGLYRVRMSVLSFRK